MKSILQISFALLLLLLFIPSLAAQPNDWNLEHLSGKVKRIDEDRANLIEKNGKKSVAGRKRHRTLIFDTKGRKTYEWYSIDRLDPFEHFYSYEKGRLYRRTVRQGIYSGGGRPTESTSMSKFTYNADENAVYQEVFIGKYPEFDVLTQKYKFLFDSSNRLIEEILYSSDNSPVIKKEYIFGDDRLPKEMRVGSVSEGSRKQSVQYTYELDLHGNWIKLTSVNTLADKDATTSTQVTYRKISYYK